MYENSISMLVNVTSAAVKQVIDVLDADVSDLDPYVVVVAAVCFPLLVAMLVFTGLWLRPVFCGCSWCSFCSGRKLIPKDDDNIIGGKQNDDDDVDDGNRSDLEDVYTDPKLKTKKTGKTAKKQTSTNTRQTSKRQTITNTSLEPIGESGVSGGHASESSDEENSKESVTSNNGRPRSESAYERDSKACCKAVAKCLDDDL